MSADDSRSGRKRFLDALEVRRNAIRGFSVGAVSAVLVYAIFVADPVLNGVPLQTGRWFWFFGIALSMALGVGGLVTTALVALRARRLVREL